MPRWVVNTGLLDLPVDSLGKWDKDETEKKWREWVSKKDPDKWTRSDWVRYKKRFLVYDAEDPEKFESYKLPVVAIVDGRPHLIREGIIAAQRALAGARREVDLPEDVKKRATNLAERLRSKADKAMGKSLYSDSDRGAIPKKV